MLVFLVPSLGSPSIFGVLEDNKGAIELAQKSIELVEQQARVDITS